ncbi:hypothetical protein [Streptomyces kanamyceticus]|uniref:hypothetical protein n=1 Tax=Streptomyces kanamyceticus TaxID=1967 RepID=UPI0037DC2CEF
MITCSRRGARSAELTRAITVDPHEGPRPAYDDPRLAALVDRLRADLEPVWRQECDKPRFSAFPVDLVSPGCRGEDGARPPCPAFNG